MKYTSNQSILILANIFHVYSITYSDISNHLQVPVLKREVSWSLYSPDDFSTQIITFSEMSFRLGAYFLNENAIDKLIRNLMRGNIESKIGSFFKNYGLVDVDIGNTYPIFLKLGITSFHKKILHIIIISYSYMKKSNLD